MKNIIQTIFILALSFQVLHAQNDKTKKADQHFNRLEFVDAIDKYEKLVSKGKADAYVYKQLAIANANLSNAPEAAKYYKMYFDNTDTASAEDYFAYAQVLMSTNDLSDAKAAYQKFSGMASSDSRAKEFKANPNFAQELMNMAPNYEASPLELNSDLSDFGGYESDSYLYFVSSRDKSNRTYGWNDQPTTDIYKAENVGGTFKNEEAVKGDVNSKYNEGTIAITNDGKTMYFTRNDYIDGDYNKSEEGISKLRIYSAQLVNNKWTNIKALPFTSSEYSVSHPALSPDNSVLYFSSDMEGGYGQSDIYMVGRNENGAFGVPENLGPEVNTEGRESFPYVDADGKLFFSSDGHLGLGGLDVFYSSENGGSFSKPQNLGAPVNSNMDDFAFTYFNSVDRGYVTSNRGENPLDDNIYEIRLLKPLDETNIIVSVTNAETNAPLANAEVIVYDDEDNQIGKLTTDANGKAELVVISNLEYDVQANLADFESDSETATAEGDKMMINLELEPIEELIVEREVTLSNIVFDFDKSTIRPEAAFELDKIVETLKKYDDINVKIESYTDSRGSESYNLTLSEARAQSTMQYLIDKGIDASRLTAEGMGESNPVIDCSNGCTEEQHEQNRRSKFIIIE